MLRDPKSTIDPARYHCLDVVQDAIELAEGIFLGAHGNHYKRFNFAYNRFGKVSEPFPKIEQKFDVILAFSVFTHMTESEMLQTLQKDLLPRLAPRGHCLFVVCARGLEYYFRQRLKRRPDLDVVRLKKEIWERKRLSTIDPGRPFLRTTTLISASGLDQKYGFGDDHLLSRSFPKTTFEKGFRSLR